MSFFKFCDTLSNLVITQNLGSRAEIWGRIFSRGALKCLLRRFGVGGAVALAAAVVQIEDARTLASVSFVVDLALSPLLLRRIKEWQCFPKHMSRTEVLPSRHSASLPLLCFFHMQVFRVFWKYFL